MEYLASFIVFLLGAYLCIKYVCVLLFSIALSGRDIFDHAKEFEFWMIIAFIGLGAFLVYAAYDISPFVISVK